MVKCLKLIMLMMVDSISMEEVNNMQNRINLYNQLFMELQQQQMTEYAETFIPASRMKKFRDCLLAFNEEDAKKFTKISNAFFAFENMKAQEDEAYLPYLNETIYKNGPIFELPFHPQMKLLFSAIDFYKSGFSANVNVLINNTVGFNMNNIFDLLKILKSFSDKVFIGENEHGQPLIISKKYRVKNIISNKKIAQHILKVYQNLDTSNQKRIQDDTKIIEDLYQNKGLNRITMSDFNAIKNKFIFKTSKVESFKNLLPNQLLLESFKENIKYKHISLMSTKLFLYKVSLYHNELTNLTYYFAEEENQEKEEYAHYFEITLKKNFIKRKLQNEITRNSIFEDFVYLKDKVNEDNIDKPLAFKFSFYDKFVKDNEIPINELRDFMYRESRLMLLFKFISKMKMLEQIKPLTLEEMINPTADQKYLLKTTPMEFDTSCIKDLLNFLTIVRHRSFRQIKKDLLIDNIASYFIAFLCGLDAIPYNSILKPFLKLPRE